ncbi:MAG: N2,N2-dimethylguanosine tRNA methyltransferase [Synechococcus sp.]|nr:N2,N2-dimethylguanosine tRNA methyltransferase [Synechococcus sp.]
MPYAEGAAELELGEGFFRPESRPSRDLVVLLAAWLGQRDGPGVRVLEAMAGSGIRGLRCGLEAGVAAVWANDADPDRLPLLERNLEPLRGRGVALRCTARTAQALLADCLIRRERFELVDLDAFGCPMALVPLALEAVAIGGVLVLASTDGRSPTGHDRPSAVRLLGASARAHPASWELALRLQLGVLARAAWAQGRGLEPLLSFSEGRTFRTAVRLQKRPAARQEEALGMVALCHGCGDQQVQSLLRLRGWAPCRCGAEAPPLAVSGPLWIGPLQHPGVVAELGALAPSLPLDPASLRLLERLEADPGRVARCWPTAEIARRLGLGPPRLEALVERLRQGGHGAWSSGVMAGQLRTDAPWAEVLQAAGAPGKHPDAAR